MFGPEFGMEPPASGDGEGGLGFSMEGIIEGDYSSVGTNGLYDYSSGGTNDLYSMEYKDTNNDDSVVVVAGLKQSIVSLDIGCNTGASPCKKRNVGGPQRYSADGSPDPDLYAIPKPCKGSSNPKTLPCCPANVKFWAQHIAQPFRCSADVMFAIDVSPHDKYAHKSGTLYLAKNLVQRVAAKMVMSPKKIQNRCWCFPTPRKG
jgi:hypothetical protein